jgi:hypothetical protein
MLGKPAVRGYWPVDNSTMLRPVRYLLPGSEMSTDYKKEKQFCWFLYIRGCGLGYPELSLTYS